MYLESSPIYHLCQKTLWLQAIDKKEPYFPPTFWTDGRLTRGSCGLDHLPRTANHYYKHVTGDWLCLEIDPVKLRQLGIAIEAHRAPESTETPPYSLELYSVAVYGGIPTVIKGVVKNVYAMQRDPAGSFYGMKPDSSVPKKVVVTNRLRHHHRPKKQEPAQFHVNESPKREDSLSTAYSSSSSPPMASVLPPLLPETHWPTLSPQAFTKFSSEELVVEKTPEATEPRAGLHFWQTKR